MKRVTRRNRGSPRGFSLVELLVVIGIIALLISIMLPSLCASKERANRVKCASNLRQIGVGMRLYANDNKGQFPRTVMNTAGNLVAFTRPDATDPFGDARPDNNDVTAALFLLVRNADLSPDVFLCPSSDGERGILTVPATSRSNFGKKELTFGVAWPYPLTDLGQRGYKWKGGAFDPTFAIAADISPGLVGPNDTNLYAARFPDGVPQTTLRLMSSLNHEREGQNCLFADGHVEWFTTPFAGVNRDHIYTSQAAAGGDPMTTPPRGRDDSVLVPTDD